MVRATGRFDVADDRELAGVMTVRGPPNVVRAPAGYLQGVDALRASIKRAVAPASPAVRALVPALVDGDDTGLADDIAADFRTAGLTHLLAVSGTNLTLIVGFLLIVARWCGVRARALVVVGILGVFGFILLARTEPSVLRAAVMGSVALVGMGLNGRDRGVRTLGVAVLGLMLFDPWLATSVGFGLSVCATGGIVLFAPGWRDSLMAWLPRWLAEAIAVPLAAQLACTPLVAAISGQVSLVAVVANLVVAMVVGPATVLGLLGGVCGLAWGGLGHWLPLQRAGVRNGSSPWPGSRRAPGRRCGLVDRSCRDRRPYGDVCCPLASAWEGYWRDAGSRSVLPRSWSSSSLFHCQLPAGPRRTGC